MIAYSLYPRSDNNIAYTTAPVQFTNVELQTNVVSCVVEIYVAFWVAIASLAV